MEKSVEIWKRLLKEGKLVYIGYSSPEKSFFEDEEALDQVMVEVFLDRKYTTGDRKLRKVKITLEVID